MKRLGIIMIFRTTMLMLGAVQKTTSFYLVVHDLIGVCYALSEYPTCYVLVMFLSLFYLDLSTLRCKL